MVTRTHAPSHSIPPTHTGMLSAAGYALVNDPAEADIWVLNSCAVKGPSEHHFLNQVRAGKQQGKGLVLAGCVPQAQPVHKDFASTRAEDAPAHAGVVSIVGVQQLVRDGLAMYSRGSSCNVSNNWFVPDTSLVRL